jgi:serine/threonine-protein kinase
MGHEIPNDFLPTMIGGPDGAPKPTVSPTAMLAIDRNAPTLAPTFADQPVSEGHVPEPTVAPTIAATRAGMSINAGMAATEMMDASGATQEFTPVAPVAIKKRTKGPKEAPKVEGYDILGELGRGGMGVVYKARHKKLDRLVALKMVIAGAHASQDQLDRFITEAQAVARLQHPDIVQVYEVSEHDGLPYFSLEFVEGGTLSHKIGGKPQSPQFASEIVLILAGAMHAAHKKNIIHRDLKPANVLLTAEGLPKITDFGLAKKLEDDSQQTRSGAIMGTPNYMAPEQAWGETKEIGPLADQYALGAILYELLTGRPPFHGATPLDTLEQVRSQEPIPPTRLQPKVPTDLETICLKALQKESPKRYTSCEELATDLQSFLDGKPIKARPVSKAEIAWRWCKRNPRIAIPTAAAVLLLIGLAVGGTYAAVTIARANVEIAKKKDQADKAAALAQLNAERAELKEKEAEHNEKIAQEQASTAVEALKTVGGEVNHTLQSNPNMAELRLRVEKIVVDQIDKVKRTTENSSEWFLTRAGAHQQLGYIYREMGKLDEYAKHMQIAEKYVEDMTKADPNDPFFQRALAKIKNAVGDLTMFDLGNAEQARAHYAQALDLRKEIAEKFPSDDANIGVANNLGLLAMVATKLGDPQTAWKLQQEEQEWRAKLSRDYVANNLQAQREQSGLYEKMGETLIKLGDPIRAQEYYDMSFNLRDEIARQQPGHVEAQMDVALALNDFGHVNLMTLNDPRSARKYYQRALERLEKLHKENPQNIYITSTLSATHYYVATAALRDGDTAAADENYQKCLDLRRGLATNPKAKMAEIDLIVALARCGYHEEAAHRVDDVLKNPSQDNQIYFQAACGYALSYGAVVRSKPMDQWNEAEKAVAKAYSDKAFDALQHGVEHGWKDLNSLQSDPDLDPIRADPRFPPLIGAVKRALGNVASQR